MSDKMREEFEKAILNGELIPCNSIVKIEGSNEYSSVLTGVAWRSWQASRAALCVELPSIGVLHHSTTYNAPDVRCALDEAGVRYK